MKHLNLLSWNKWKCILPQGITCENNNKNVAFIRIKVAWVFLCRHDLKFSKSAQRQCQWRMWICLLWQQGLKTTLGLIWRISAERYNSVISCKKKLYTRQFLRQHLDTPSTTCKIYSFGYLFVFLGTFLLNYICFLIKMTSCNLSF